MQQLIPAKYLQIPSLNFTVPHWDSNPGSLALKSETLTTRLSLLLLWIIEPLSFIVPMLLVKQPPYKTPVQMISKVHFEPIQK